MLPAVDSLEKIPTEYIINNPDEYIQIVKDALKKSRFPALILKTTINDEFIKKYPEKYCDIVAEASTTDATVLGSFAAPYTRSSVKLVKYVKNTLIEHHPFHYKELFIRLIKEKKAGINNIRREFVNQNPMFFKEILIVLLETNKLKDVLGNVQEKYRNINELTIFFRDFYHYDCFSFQAGLDFNSLLHEIALKRNALLNGNGDRDYTVEDAEAADAALNLVINIYIESIRFNTKAISLEEFQNNCTNEINNARPLLERHRGLKKAVYNLGLFILGLGVVYGLACLVNLAVTRGKHFFFHFPTDSEGKINKLQAQIDQMEEPVLEDVNPVNVRGR